jgi:acetyl-CoA carboxylase biotin carboxyl carrier protein
MDIKKIQELIKLINKSNIGELTIEEDGVKITLKQKKEHIVSQGTSYPVQQQVPQQQIAQQAAPTTQTETPKADNLITIKSPMIGTFYRQAGPDKPVFANIGDEVEPGTVVCIIEAMKLFNEIESEIKGKIVKVLVEDASPVEYDQPLFLVDPS